MSLKSSEIDDLLKSLKSPKSWNDSSIGKDTGSYLRRAFNTHVREVDKSEIHISYHIDLKKELDASYKGCLLFLLRYPSESKPEVLEDLLGSIRHAILSEGLDNQSTLVFVLDSKNGLKEYIEDQLNGSILLDEKNLVDWLKDSYPVKSIISKLKSSALELSKCPFHYLGPCTDIFVGREKLVREILLDSSVGYAIAGGRRIGKTSLLFKIQSEIKNEKKIYSKKYHPLYIDCSNFKSFQQLMSNIMRTLFPSYFIHQSVPDINFTFNQILGRATSIMGEKLFLLLDEMDPLVKLAKEKNEDTDIFFNSIRAETNNGRLKFVISGFREISEMVKDSNHPFYNLCEKIRLGVLDKKETGELISLPLFKLGISLSPKEKIISRLYDFTGGHPSMVQFIARRLFQNRKSNNISLKDFENAIKDEISIEFILDNFIRNTNSFERLICLLTIDEETIDEGSVVGKLDQEGVLVEDLTTRVHNSLRNLVYNNIFAQIQGQYGFLYPMMRSIIREYYQADSIVAALKREVK